MQRRPSTGRNFSAPPLARWRPGGPRSRRTGSCCSTWRSPNAAERDFVHALVGNAPDALATVPAGDAATERALAGVGTIDRLDPGASGLDRVRRHLFAEGTTPVGEPLDEVELFSAPGEGREAVEIARRVLREARAGTRSTRWLSRYARRSSTPASSNTRSNVRACRPASNGARGGRIRRDARSWRLIACAQENLSARRFAEYLSLGQVPDPREQRSRDAAYPTSQDEVFGALAERADQQAANSDDSAPVEATPACLPGPLEMGTVDCRVTRGLVGRSLGAPAERVDGECRLQQEELTRTDPESGRVEHLSRKIDDLQGLAAFALPIMRTLSDWPAQARWSDWLDAVRSPRTARARQTRAGPAGARRPAADGKPSGRSARRSGAGSAPTVSARSVRAASAALRPRFVASRAHCAVERRRRLVPALAERMFPERPADPLLLDAARHALGAKLPTQTNRSEQEKQHLRLAVGAASAALRLVPDASGWRRAARSSLYALEAWRAMTGRVPSADELQQAAAHASQATPPGGSLEPQRSHRRTRT